MLSAEESKELSELQALEFINDRIKENIRFGYSNYEYHGKLSENDYNKLISLGYTVKVFQLKTDPNQKIYKISW